MEKTKEIDILDVLIILAKHKKFIFWTVLIVSIATVIYSLVVPEIWSSTAVISPVISENNQFSLSSSSIFGLGSALFGSSVSSSAQDFITIMKSRTFTDKIIDKFDLINFLRIKENDPWVARDIARELLRKRVRRIEFDDEAGMIIISISTHDQNLSAEIANFYWQELERYNQEFNLTNEKRNRIFIENRIKEIEIDIERLSKDLQAFMEANKAIELESQTKSIVDIYSNLISKKIENEIELAVARQMYSSESFSVRNLEALGIEISDQLKRIEFLSDDNDKDYTLTLKDVPALTIELASILLNLDIQKTLYEYLYPQYEKAKIDEVKDFPTIKVLDEAEVAGRRSKPKRARLCITNFVLSLLFSIFSAFLIDYFQAKKDKTKILKKKLFKL